MTLLQEVRGYITGESWAGGQSSGYYCKLCYHHMDTVKKPKTSCQDIQHKPTCLLARIDAAIAQQEGAK